MWLINNVFSYPFTVGGKPIISFSGKNLSSVYIFTLLPFRSEINIYRNNCMHVYILKNLTRLSKQFWIKEFPVILGIQFWSSALPPACQPLNTVLTGACCLLFRLQAIQRCKSCCRKGTALFMVIIFYVLPKGVSSYNGNMFSWEKWLAGLLVY